MLSDFLKKYLFFCLHYASRGPGTVKLLKFVVQCPLEGEPTCPSFWPYSPQIGRIKGWK